MSNELVPNSFYDKIEDPMKAIERLGEIIVKSSMFGCDRPEQGAMIAMACMSEKKDPLQIARTYHIIQGKLSKKYDAMLAEFYSEGGKVVWHERTDEVVEATFVHPQNGEIKMRVEMATLVKNGVALKPNGQLKDTYAQHPANMITARLVSNAMRLVCPSSVCGVYTPEEVGDFGSKPVNTAPPKRESKLGATTKAKPKAKKPAPAPVEAPEEVVVTAEVVVDPEPAPVAEKAPEPPVAPEPAVAEVVAESENTIIELNPLESEANAYLVNLNWITEGQTYRDLQPDHAAMLRDKLGTFIEKIQEGKNV
jgi:hypothetical protein